MFKTIKLAHFYVNFILANLYILASMGAYVGNDYWIFNAGTFILVRLIIP